MKLSSKGRYGLQAIVDLAINCEMEPVSIKSISKRLDISERYLEKIFAMLKKGKLVESVRGAGGGYRLTKPGSEISVGEVLRCLEGNVTLVDCEGFTKRGECNSPDSCLTRYVWDKINKAINDTMDTTYIDELTQKGSKSLD